MARNIEQPRLPEQSAVKQVAAKQEKPNQLQKAFDTQLSRRTLLRRAAALSVSAPVLGTFITACLDANIDTGPLATAQTEQGTALAGERAAEQRKSQKAAQDLQDANASLIKTVVAEGNKPVKVEIVTSSPVASEDATKGATEDAEESQVVEATAETGIVPDANGEVRHLEADIETAEVGLSGFPESADTQSLSNAREQSREYNAPVDYGYNAEGEDLNELQGVVLPGLAEPGVLLYGNYDEAVANEQDPGIWSINPTTQYVFENAEGKGNVVEGQFMVASLGEGVINIQGLTSEDNYTLDLVGKQGRNHIVIIRGLYGDDNPDTDSNRTAYFTELAKDGGHALYMRYPAGTFVSKTHFDQLSNTSHTGGSNCGDGGCTELIYTHVDLNTGFVGTFRQEGTDGAWEEVYSNGLYGK